MWQANNKVLHLKITYAQTEFFKDHFQVIGQLSCTHEPETNAINTTAKNKVKEEGVSLGQIHPTASVSVCSAKNLLRRAAFAS